MTVEEQKPSAWQWERLQQTWQWANNRSSFYQRKFASIFSGTAALQLNSAADLLALPLTTEQEIRQSSPYDLLTLPLSGIVRAVRVGSRQLGKFYTAHDVAGNISLTATALQAAGVHRGSVVALLKKDALYDVQYALESLGALTIPVPEDSRALTQLWRQFGFESICATSGQIRKILPCLVTEIKLCQVICLTELNEKNLAPAELNLPAEVKVVPLYTSDILGCHGVLCPSDTASVMRVNMDWFYPEIVQPTSGEPVCDINMTGELVLTTLVAEAMPIIRYRTGLMVKFAQNNEGRLSPVYIKIASRL